MRRTKRKLPDSLTQHLSDPKVVAFRPRPRQRNAYRVSGSAQQIAISAVTLIVVVLERSPTGLNRLGFRSQR